MVWTPDLKIYDSTGASLIYTFTYVQSVNLPQSVTDYVEVSNLNAGNSLIIDGGNKSWDLIFRFILHGDDYEDLTSKIATLESTVALKTAYKLRFDKTPSTYFEYNVKRLEPFLYDDSRRTKFQRVTGTFKANCW